VISKDARDLLQKMLNKKPSQRITIAQMKQHPFFATINWDLLAQKKIKPPVVLSMDDEDVQKEAAPDENEEEKFLNFDQEAAADDGARNNQKDLFEDADYKENNKTLNRVKQFTFIKT